MFNILGIPTMQLILEGIRINKCSESCSHIAYSKEIQANLSRTSRSIYWYNTLNTLNKVSFFVRSESGLHMPPLSHFHGSGILCVKFNFAEKVQISQLKVGSFINVQMHQINIFYCLEESWNIISQPFTYVALAQYVR